MGGLNDIDPLRDADAPGRNVLANFVDKNFRGGARQAADAGVFERDEIIANGGAGERRAVKHFFRRKSMNVQIGQALLSSARQKLT